MPERFERLERLKWFDWRVPLYAGLLTIAVCLGDALVESDGLLYFFVIIPIVSLFLLVILLTAAISRKLRSSLAIISILAVFWFFSFILLKNHFATRNAARWYLRSRHYKALVVAQPSPLDGDLKHIEWDGWGFPGAGDTTVYLVYDPTNSLAPAARSHQASKYEGIPCTVPLISRLESGWYAVLFFTDERWGKPGKDCGAE